MQGDKEFKIMKQRIDYIDRMKGMAIFLVVMGHVYGMVFNQGEDITYKWISSFHMPLFMVLWLAQVLWLRIGALESWARS